MRLTHLAAIGRYFTIDLIPRVVHFWFLAKAKILSAEAQMEGVSALHRLVGSAVVGKKLD